VNPIDRLFSWVINLMYAASSASLFVISVAMIASGIGDVYDALQTGVNPVQRMLDATGLIVVAIAVFDVAKYLIEEELLRRRELRSPTEARQTLTKFLVIITIAVSLEALVFIFGAGKAHMEQLLYPTLLLVAAVLLVVGLGAFQRLSVSAERAGRERP
jgi:hypothetical protein